MTRVYISGPMTGLPECNFPAFHAAAAELRARGYEVANPAEINAETGGDWHFYLRADIKALCDCDAIVLLPGWENSKGAHLELHVAHRLGLRVSTLAAYGVRACGSNECIAGQRDGVICANGECDRVNGVRPDGVATRHPRCGYPYCACVGECFAASQPGVTDGVLEPKQTDGGTR